MRRKRFGRRRALGKAELTLTPLIDTALTLLIIFMITAPIMKNAIKVALPDGRAKEAENDKQELVVHVDSHEKIFLNNESIPLDRLIATLKEKVGPGQETVFVRADKSVSYGKVISIVDQIKVVGGVEYVALATQAPVQA